MAVGLGIRSAFVESETCFFKHTYVHAHVHIQVNMRVDVSIRK